MSAPDPIFSKSDTGALDGALPTELQGKSAEEIAAYYQRREAILMDRMRQRPPDPPKKEDVPDDHIDLFNDAAGSVQRVVTRQVNEAMDRMATVATPAIVASCRMALKENHPADYARFIDEVDKHMKTMTPAAQMNPEFWELTYNTIKGRVADKLVEEGRLAERKKMENPIEAPTPPGTKPDKPRELTPEETTVAGKFGQTNDEYRAAQDRYDKDDGRLPFTTDSRKKKKSGAA